MSKKPQAKTLKPKKGTRKSKTVNYACADIEAFNWTNFLCIGFYDGQQDYYTHFEEDIGLNDFLSYTFDYCYHNDIENMFFQFGGIYDFMFILREAFMSGDWIIECIIPRGSGILSFEMRQLNPTMFKANGKPFCLNYRDSSALLPFGLDSMASTFGVATQKQKIDYEDFEEMWKTKKGKKQILNYLEADCMAHWQCLEVFFNWDLVERAGRAFTTASQAIKIWRLFLPCEIKAVPETWEPFIRKAYMGGRTEVFRPVFCADYDIKNNPHDLSKNVLKILKKQKKHGKLMYADANSLYPFSMLNDFPIAHDRRHLTGKTYDPEKLGIWEATVKVPKDMFCPPLGVKIEINGTEKLIYPSGTFTGHWTNKEIEYSRSIGVEIIKIHRGMTFINGGKIFAYCINTLYKRRLKAKKEGDKVNDALCKLIMNCIYGRLALRTDDKEMLEVNFTDSGFTPHIKIELPDGRNVHLSKKPSDMDNMFIMPAIPVFVTSYSRIHIHKFFMQAGEENLYYSDTDSLFYTGENTFKFGKELGELKLEYTCKSACFLLPKTYMNDGIEGESYDHKVTMKGFNNKKVQHMGFDDFFECLKGDISKLSIIEKPKFAKFKTALQLGKLVTMNYEPKTEEEQRELRKIDKEKEVRYYRRYGVKKKFEREQYEFRERRVKSQYDKRVIINEGFSSKPLFLTGDKNNEQIIAID